MKLEPNMYIRTNEGIRKIIGEYDEGYELDRSLHYQYPEGHDLYKESLNEDIDEIVLSKPSHNIIGLIEKGDYVNGYKVYETDCVKWIVDWQGRQIDIDYLKIETILTHEIFEREAYKVE